MKLKAITGIVLTMLLLVVASPICISVGEGKRGGMLGQHESLQAYSYSEPPEIEWNRTYGGLGVDYANSILQINDGGYVLGGYLDSTATVSGYGWLVKLDSDGDMVWNKTYGEEYGAITSVVQTSDGGYAFVGHAYIPEAGTDKDCWLGKVDSNGNMIWNKTYGGVHYDYAYSLVQTSSGYVFAGQKYDYAWLVKVDSDGDMVWNKTYGEGNYGYALSVLNTSDGGYIFAGGFGAPVSSDFWLVKVNSSGDVEWNKTYGGADPEMAYSVVQTSDEGYALAGYREYEIYPNFYSNYLLVKVDSSGNEEWREESTGNVWEKASSVVETYDGGYLLAGHRYWGAYDMQWLLVGVNSIGEEQWQERYGGTDIDNARSIIQTNDGGYAVAGRGYDDLWLIKFAPEAPPPYDVTIKAHCYTEGVDVSVSITMDGSPTGYNTPHTFTSLNGTHTFTVPSTDPQGHPFYQWSTGETSTTITVTSGGTYTAYYGAPPPVGGVWVPVNKFELLAPYIGLASTILVATAATAIYVKHVKRRKKKQ